MNDEELGRRIKVARQRKGWSQEELGALVGVNQRTIGNWERGNHRPQGALPKLEDVLRIDLSTGEPRGGDPVKVAILDSALSESAQYELLSHYARLLDEMRRAGSA